jgi:hypothetical protein
MLATGIRLGHRTLKRAKETRRGSCSPGRRARLTRDVQAMDIPAVLGASGDVLLAMVDHRSGLKLMRVAILTPSR